MLKEERRAQQNKYWPKPHATLLQICGFKQSANCQTNVWATSHPDNKSNNRSSNFSAFALGSGSVWQCPTIGDRLVKDVKSDARTIRIIEIKMEIVIVIVVIIKASC